MEEISNELTPAEIHMLIKALIFTSLTDANMNNFQGEQDQMIALAKTLGEKYSIKEVYGIYFTDTKFLEDPSKVTEVSSVFNFHRSANGGRNTVKDNGSIL